MSVSSKTIPVMINDCYGGFEFSDVAIDMYKKEKYTK